MNLKSLLIVLFCLVSVAVMAEGDKSAIDFEHGTWAQTLKKAKKEKKLIFVDCYTSWCGPCKKLSKTVFTQKAVGDYFNANFVSMKVDCEKGEGVKIKEMYEVSAFPTMLIIDAKKNIVVHRMVGFRTADQLIAEAKSAPAKYMKKMELAKEARNNTSIESMEAYLQNLINNRDPDAAKVAVEYLNMIPKDSWKEQANFNLMREYVSDPFSPEAKYYYKNKAEFEKVNGYYVGFFESKLFYGYMDKLTDVKTREEFDQAKMDKLLKVMGSIDAAGLTKFQWHAELNILISTGDYAGYMTEIEKVFNEGIKTNPHFYVEKGFNYLNRLKNCTDKAVFMRAADCCDEVIAKQLALDELNMFDLSIAYRDRYDNLVKAEATGARLDAAKEIAALMANMMPKHRKLLDETFTKGQTVDKTKGKVGRSIPAMKMGGM